MADKKMTRRKLITTGIVAAGAVAAGGLLCSDEDRIDPDIFEDPVRDKMPASRVISPTGKRGQGRALEVFSAHQYTHMAHTHGQARDFFRKSGKGA